jgi:DNA-binding response OmpR family regulator
MSRMALAEPMRASLLVITPDDLFGRTLETLFAPAGYEVIRVPVVEDAMQRARRRTPDVVLLHAELLRTDAAATCARLRELPELGHRTPLVVCSTDPLSPAQRRDALRAGAWHLLEAPFDPADLLPRLEVFAQAKREAEKFRQAAFWDPVTGFYTPLGIQHRAVELASLAARAREPLACVVLSPAVASVAREPLLEGVARALRDLGRRSDAIGSLGDGQFAVVAPATPAPGAARLAERVASGVDVIIRPDLRAGFDVAANVDQPTAVALRLIDHARRAAFEAGQSGPATWIRAYGTV